MHLLFNTGTRVYMFGALACGLYSVQYRPINPRTGRVWQAARGIPGQDAYILGTYKGVPDGEPPRTTGIVLGEIPENWYLTPDKWTWAQSGFSTFEKADAAARAHAHKSEKPRPAVPKNYGLATKP